MGRYYRFYGARHSILQLGYLIDFEVQQEGTFLPRMRSLSHLPFPWLFEPARLMVWQNMLQQLEIHLRDATSIDPFYYDTLLESAKKWHRQNPKRLAVEWYVAMLDAEGRLDFHDRCYICEGALHDRIALMSGFNPAHPECIYAPPLRKTDVVSLFDTHRSLHLDDHAVDTLYALMMKAF